jgi:hypothetical protein
LSSDDSVTSFNEDVAEELKKKHPSPSRELFFPDATTIFNTVKQKNNSFFALEIPSLRCFTPKKPTPTTIFNPVKQKNSFFELEKKPLQ